jgi:hypothetical protein
MVLRKARLMISPAGAGGAMLGLKVEDELELAWAYMTIPGIAGSISY